MTRAKLLALRALSRHNGCHRLVREAFEHAQTVVWVREGNNLVFHPHKIGQALVENLRELERYRVLAKWNFEIAREWNDYYVHITYAPLDAPSLTRRCSFKLS